MRDDIIQAKPSGVGSAPGEELVSGLEGIAISLVPETAGAARAKGIQETEADLDKRRTGKNG